MARPWCDTPLLFHICGVAPQLAICPSHSLAKFGNKYDMKLNKFNVPSHLLASSIEKSDFSFEKNKKTAEFFL